MKIITSIARILVGLLFMFSGLIKSNDPKGTAIKFNEYFNVFANEFYIQPITITQKISDNIDKDTQWQIPISLDKNNLNISINQSAPKVVVYEEDGVFDSVLTFDLFVLADNQQIYYQSCYAEDTLDPIKLNVSVLDGKKPLFEKQLSLTSLTKYEISETIDLKPYQVKQGFWYGFFRALRPFAIYLSIFMCVLEVVLGFAILIGWKPNLTSWLLLGIIIFFTFLTWYSAYFNKVTDCGCFGDFIKLEPWTSFWKDIFLLVFIGFLFFRRKKIIPLFSPLFGWNAVLIILISTSVFTIYANMYLPAWDFLPFKMGNNINSLLKRPANERVRDSVESIMVYEKDGKQQEFTLKNFPKTDDWKFIETRTKILAPAWKSAVHGFEFSSRTETNNENIKDSLLFSKNYVVLIVSPDLEKSSDFSWNKIAKLYEGCRKQNISFYAVSANAFNVADAFQKQKNLPFYFNTGDETLLKTMMRSNPGVMLWKNGVIINKWSCRSVPQIDKIVKIVARKKNKN